MNILIVDDSRVMRMIVHRALRQTGLQIDEVYEACDGREGLAISKDKMPDWILCDWNMPKMNGIEMLRALRGEGNVTPFGFVTSQSAPEVRAEAREAGAQFLITKPFTPEAFLRALSA
ncbi:MAG: two-component system chemotaxis response regulator CheY [Bradymonadia bacterium]|jgi:two-component system chemotaxis response regulator CheY